MTISKEYETIDTVKLRYLLETTRNLGRLLTEENYKSFKADTIDYTWL